MSSRSRREKKSREEERREGVKVKLSNTLVLLLLRRRRRWIAKYRAVGTWTLVRVRSVQQPYTEVRSCSIDDVIIHSSIHPTTTHPFHHIISHHINSHPLLLIRTHPRSLTIPSIHISSITSHPSHLIHSHPFPFLLLALPACVIARAAKHFSVFRSQMIPMRRE